MTDFVMKELDWLRTAAPAVAASPESFDLDGLMPRYERAVRALEAVLDEAAKAENGALRWADPLPVPSWVFTIRGAVGHALLAGQAMPGDTPPPSASGEATGSKAKES